MAGLLGFLAAGAVKGAGDGIVAEARAKREAAIAELENSRLVSRENASRAFQAEQGSLDRGARASEAATDREFRSKEGALDRNATAEENRLTRAAKAATDNDGVKMPSGFMPDPDTPGAIMPIPGGPGEQIAGELAARVGLVDKFLTRAPALRKRLAAGEASGPYDVAQARNNQSSPQAEVQRELEFGVEALVRMLTGAGMNASEADERARRYLPTYTDDAGSMTKKLDDLTDYLESTKEVAMRGRGGRVGDRTAQTKDETTSVPKSPTSTSTGVKWSVE